MTVGNLCVSLNAKSLCIKNPDREVEGAYAGDLLSWVMGRANEGNAWVTIMSNVNVIAVASLTGVSCVIFADGVVPDDEALHRAENEGINLISSQMSSYEICAKLSMII